MSIALRKTTRWISLLGALIMVLAGVIPAAADPVVNVYENSAWTPPSGLKPPVSVAMSANMGTDSVTVTLRGKNNTGFAMGKVMYQVLIPDGHKVLDSWVGRPGNSPGNINGNWVEFIVKKGASPMGKTSAVSVAFDWDGVTPMTTRGRLVWQPTGTFTAKGKTISQAAGPPGWWDGEHHQWVYDAMSPVFTIKGPVKDPAAPAGQIPDALDPPGLPSSFVLGMTSAVSGDAITYSIQGQNVVNDVYTQCRVASPIPAGANVLTSWMGNEGQFPGGIDDQGRIFWNIGNVKPMGLTPMMSYSINWDGQTPQTTSAMMSCATGPSAWTDEFGGQHRDVNAKVIIVKDSNLKDAAQESGIPDAPAVTGFEKPLTVALAAVPSADKTSVTITMRAQNNTGQLMNGVRIIMPIPEGTTLVNSWAGNISDQGAGGIDDAGNLFWNVKGNLAPRAPTTPFVYTVTGWDGKTPLKIQATGKWRAPMGLGWIDEGGGVHNEVTSAVVIVK